MKRAELTVITLLVLSNALLWTGLTNVVICLPAIGRDLNSTSSQVHWIVTGALLPVATISVITGRWGDRFGRRRIFVTGLSTFGFASVFCGLAPNETVLVLARVGQGIGCALALPLTMSHLAGAFPAAKRGRVFGLATTASTVLQALAPLALGLVVDHASWRWVFFFNAPVAAALAVAALRVLPEHRESVPAPMDARGCGLLAASLTILVVAFENDSDWGISDWKTLTLIIFGFGTVAIFAIHEIRIEQPLLRIDLLKNKTVYTALAALALVQCVSLVVSVNSALYLQHVEELGAFITALILLAGSIGTIVASPWGGRLTDKGAGVRVLALGMAVCAGGGMLMLCALVETQVRVLFVLGLLMIGLGAGLVYSPASALTVSSLDESERGLASALTVQARQIGATVGFSIVQTILTEAEWARRRSMAATRDIPQAGLDAVFNGSHEGRHLIAQLPGKSAGRITAAVDESYLFGLNVVLACLATVLVVGSVLTVLAFRARTAGGRRP